MQDLLLNKRVIAFEGLNGVGKSTLINLVSKKLNDKSITNQHVHDPLNNSHWHNLLKQNDFNNPHYLALSYAASSIYTIEYINNNNNNINLVDRSALSTFAYYLTECGFDWLFDIHKTYKYPSKIFYIYSNEETILRRLKLREKLEKDVLAQQEINVKLSKNYKHIFKKFKSYGLEIYYIDNTSNDIVSTVHKICEILNKD